MNDKEIGRKVLRYFYNWNRLLYPKVFAYSFDEFLSSYGKKIDIYMDGIGLGVRSAGVSDSRIDAAMNALAMNSAGKIPSDYQVYFKYIQDEAVKISWMDAAAYVAKESASDILNGAKEIGDTLIFSGKILKFIIPLAVFVIAYFWVKRKSGGFS